MAVEAAKQAVLKGLADFDQAYSALEAALPSLQYNDIVKRLNALIAQLQPLSAHFNTIGGTRIKEDVDCVNELISGFNTRMKNIEALGARAKQNIPPPQPRPQETTVSLPPPNRQAPQQPQAQPQSNIVVEEAPALIPLPANVVAAIAQFDAIYDAYLKLTGPDVWTGRSNDLVHRWSSFCQTTAPTISQATSLRLQRDSLDKLRACIEKFNTFASTLTGKINSLQINDHQKQVILRFGPDHDAAMNTFKQHLNSGNRAILDAQFTIIKNLQKSLKDLGIDSHPQVSNNLGLCADTLAKMADVFSQMDRDAQIRAQKVAEQYQQQHPQAAPSNVGLAKQYEEPRSPRMTYEDFVQNLEIENEQIEETFDLPLPVQAPPQAAPAVAGPKFCPECGAPNQGKRFCGECGFQFGTY